MKHRNRRILQITVLLVLLFFILSTVGLSLISLTYNEVQAPTDQDIVNEYNEEDEVMTWEVSAEFIDGVILTGSFAE